MASITWEVTIYAGNAIYLKLHSYFVNRNKKRHFFSATLSVDGLNQVVFIVIG